MTSRTGPPRVADALMAEEAIHAEAILAGVSGAQVYLPLAPLAGETYRRGTRHREIGDR